MNTAVVTGATGFIGSALTKKLSQKGYLVYAIGRNENRLKKLAEIENVKVVRADFKEYHEIDKRIDTKVDMFFHCAFEGGFNGSSLKDYALQLENTKYSCEAVDCAIRMNCEKFVLASTVNTAEILTFLKQKDFSPRYTCIYSAAKLTAGIMGKTLSRNKNMKFCTAMIAMPYGVGNSAETLPNIVIRQLLQHNSPKLIEGNNLYDLIYIEDVASGLCAIGEKGRDFIDYYVGHRQLETFKTWMIRMRDILSPCTALKFGEYPDAPAIDYDLIDLNSLFNDTGFQCQVDFEESILKTAEWLRMQKEGGK